HPGCSRVPGLGQLPRHRCGLGEGTGGLQHPGLPGSADEPFETPEHPPVVTPGHWQLLTELLWHNPVTPELGAVLAPDGSVVALSPLLAGIEVGLRSGGFERPLPTLDPPADPLLAVTIAEALGTSFLLARGGDNNATALGPDGCWDNVENPQNHTLRGPPSPVPNPVAIGALDGVVLGVRLARGPLLVSEQLWGYYRTGNGSEAGRPPSSNRRRDFGALVGRERLEKEVAAVLGLLRTLSPIPELLRDVGTQEVAAVARWVAREFSKCYVGTGGVAPREWGWHPLNGVVTSQTGVSPPESGCHPERGLSPPKWQLSLQKWGLSPHKGGERVWKGPPPRPLGGQYCVSWMATTVSAGHQPPPCPLDGHHCVCWTPATSVSSGWPPLCLLDTGHVHVPAKGPPEQPLPVPSMSPRRVLQLDKCHRPHMDTAVSPRTCPAPCPHMDSYHVPKELLVPTRPLLCPQGVPCPPMSPRSRGTAPSHCPGRVPGHRAPLPVGGRPYRGTPSLLRPPLGSVFLHHTLEPARPCRSFGACASAMRDMQRFHQDTRSWDDIGYRSLSPPLVPVTSHGPWHPPVGRVIVPLWALPPPLSPLTVPVTPMGLRHPPWSPSLSPCIPHHCPSTVPLTVPHCLLTVPPLSPHCPFPVPTTVPHCPHHCPHHCSPLSPTVPSLSPHCPLTVPVMSSQFRGGLGRVPV
uniref:Uncharacterized protein n=1 Tax=Corvus moneduloides TaxID=1196302 RepID=A0A8U7NL62_CORMO